jgi:hypothetical protein
MIREEKPINEGGRRAPKGRLTWFALIGMIAFVAALFVLFARSGS